MRCNPTFMYHTSVRGNLRKQERGFLREQECSEKKCRENITEGQLVIDQHIYHNLMPLLKKINKNPVSEAQWRPPFWS
ncbi:hypothetical protein BIW11_03535 [Tropilaelaps mercedesae]|uniref:Uncharacterized protein n=1 Tax=Tropilaelaps mercedesae TaxID=418985 RepID=A0A1V9XJC6_9ACAR|nr:hypothetical protein BIW11_03535 [Tropilaelaps mercedesae]